MIFLLFATAHAQRMKEKGFGLIHLERHQVTLGTGFRYELGLFKNVSASTSLTPGVAFYQEGYTGGLAWNTRVRYYHNIEERLDINKNVIGNSADYLALGRSVFWGPLQLSQNLRNDNQFAIEFFGGLYGLQRTFRNGFNFNAEVGFGYYQGDTVSDGYGPMLNFTLGWVLTKRKKKDNYFNGN